MSDRHTRTVLARRRRGKRLLAGAAGAVLGLLLKMLFGTEPIGSFFDQFQLAGELLPPARLWLDAHPAVTGWIAGPVMLGLLFFAFAGLPPVRRALDRFLPDPPPFVRASLEEARNRERMISLEGPPLPFVGREDALAGLDALLTPVGQPFAWRSLIGPSGIGKTRLAIEWLERAKAQGWDVGILDRDDFTLVEGWKARRATALVVDETRRDWGGRLGDLLAALSAAGAAEQPLRLLLVDQVSPWVDIAWGESRDAVRAGEAGRPLRLRQMNEAEIASLCAVSQSLRVGQDTVFRESAGRPRAALILINACDATSYAGALTEWAVRVVPGLSDPHRPLPPSLIGPLCLAALAGPVDTDLGRELFGSVDVEALERFYSDESRDQLEQRLPALTPDDVSGELLLRLLPRLDRKLRETAFDRLMSASPAAVEWRLATLWRSRKDMGIAGEDEAGSATLAWLQERFDATFPDRLERALKDAAASANAVLDEASTPLSVDNYLARLAEIADARPYNSEIRLAEASGAVNAINQYGERQDWCGLERWGRRLLQVVALDLGSARAALRKYVALGSVNAMAAYGRSGDFDALERWSETATGPAHDARSPADLELKCQEARAAACAILRYGEAGRFEDVERWAHRLIGITADERCANCPEIALVSADAGVNATYNYGAAKRFDDMERWGNHVVSISRNANFAGNEPIRVQEARCALNIIKSYCEAGRIDSSSPWEKRIIHLAEDDCLASSTEFNKYQAKVAGAIIDHHSVKADLPRLDWWCNRLIRIVNDDRFSADSEVAMEEARGAVNAIFSYGRLGQFEKLEWWGKRLIALSAEERFSGRYELQLLEARAAVNASLCYGLVRNFEGLERWAGRLTELARHSRFEGDPEIWANEARCAMNATRSYGEAKQIEDVERWAKALIVLGDDKRFAGNVEIRRLEARGIFNAIVGYGVTGRQDWPRMSFWRGRLGQLSRDWPGDPEIQALVAEFGLSAISQLSRR